MIDICIEYEAEYNVKLMVVKVRFYYLKEECMGTNRPVIIDGVTLQSKSLWKSGTFNFCTW